MLWGREKYLIPTGTRNSVPGLLSPRPAHH